MNAIPGWINDEWRLGMTMSESEAGEQSLREEHEAAMAAWQQQKNTSEALAEMQRSYCRA